MPRKHDNLEALWSRLAKRDVDSFEICRASGKMLVELDGCYLFKHPGLSGQTKAPKDAYWKGLVKEIRLASPNEALVKVRWFWMHKDVEAAISGEEVDPKLQQMLDAMAKNELWAGSAFVINSSDTIESDVHITRLTDQCSEPVIDYFFRFAWDEGLKVVHGMEAYGCGKTGCARLWNPEREEQRYCSSCSTWYHTSCLSVDGLMSQEDWYSAACLASKDPSLPDFLLRMAHQPIARGGPYHFTAGNIRFVSHAKGLVSDVGKLLAFTEGEVLNDSEWEAKLKEHWGIRNKDHRNPKREKLVVNGQNMHHCIKELCKGLI